MPRKGGVARRQAIADLKYQDLLVSRFINGLMGAGKKSIAQRILYNAMEILGQRGNDDSLKLFHQAVDNVKPLIEVKSRRVGGATYQVPVEVRADRRVSLAIRWLISFAKARSEKSMEAKLAAELADAANNRGATIKKREDTHKMAEANKAFAHYRW
ncbi:MAG: 30S ribosomal protein S7 [Desulfobaccales bacterium]|jgi:small subunit ribosomal protein S7